MVTLIISTTPVLPAFSTRSNRQRIGQPHDRAGPVRQTEDGAREEVGPVPGAEGRNVTGGSVFFPPPM